MLKTHKVKTKPGLLVKLKNYLPSGGVEANSTANWGMPMQTVSLLVLRLSALLLFPIPPVSLAEIHA